MDQAPKSTDQWRTDHNNNGNSEANSCSCSNISIMQLFHEMKQEFPKVPDHIVQQHVTENCHNRSACIDNLRQAAIVNTPTTTMYPSKSIHSNQQTPRSPVNGVKWANNQKMKEISEMFENSSSDASTSSDCRLKRPTTLKLRRAPDPPTSSSTASSSASTPNSTSSLSKFTSTASSTSSLVASTTSVNSSSSNQQYQAEPYLNQHQQFHHNVTLDSTASKCNDSLNVQLNLTVSPITSSAPPIPPRPTRPARHMSQLTVQPEPAFTSMLDPKKTLVGETSASTGTTGQRSYTSVNFTLRQPASILPSPQTPIDIQAGPSSLTYSSSSFDAKQGYQSHLKITVAGNGESRIQAVRTKQPTGNALPEISQIDTTIDIGGKGKNDAEPIRIKTAPNNQQKLAISRLTEDELRQVIRRQMKQKELLECELTKEREKLEMVRFDIITLTAPMMTRSELQQLCDEISRLRSACERLADEIDVVSAPPRSPAVTSPSRPPPPNIPAALRCLSLHQSPFHSQLPPLDTSRMNFPPAQPPSYNEVMRASGRTPVSESLPNLVNDSVSESWACHMCTFLNYPLLNQCEQCDMPRTVPGITITSSSYRPLRQNNQMQRESVATNHDNNNIITTAL